MNSLDPSLAKYLSKSKQDIYDEYHGKKKKKSKSSKVVASDGTGLLIADDTGDSGWNGSSAWNGGSGMLVDDDDDRQPVVEHRSSGGFRPLASTSALPQPADEAIPADEAPLVVGQVIEEAPTAGSSSAFASKRLKGGLQTSAQLKEENARRRQAAEAEREAAKARLAATTAGPGDAAAEETVYRDKSGKKIDTKAAKAEAARQKRAEMEKEMQKMEWGKGLVQREDQERKRQEVEEMANRPFARHADDEDLNDSLKERERWNDPAARFLSDSKGDKKKSKGPSRPKYSGPAPPPNRFGILPGYRWDGVDRSNGFERELVQASNRRKVKDAAARVYSTEDM